MPEIVSYNTIVREPVFKYSKPDFAIPTGMVFECFNCKATLRTNDADKQKVHPRLDEQGNVPGWVLYCPNCGHIPFVPTPMCYFLCTVETLDFAMRVKDAMQRRGVRVILSRQLKVTENEVDFLVLFPGVKGLYVNDLHVLPIYVGAYPTIVVGSINEDVIFPAALSVQSTIGLVELSGRDVAVEPLIRSLDR